MASSFDNPGKIFIGGISPTTTQDTIQKYFEQYGELCDCVLMQDKATGKSRCFGFVTYKDPTNLDEVLSKKHIIDAKEIDCKRAIPRDQQSDQSKDGSFRTKKLFVGGLTQTTAEDQFRKYFEQFGTIEDSVIMVDKETGKSRGFGFITFASEDSVDRVIEQYHDNKIDGKWVECKRAQAKDFMPQSKKGGKHDPRGQSDSRHGSRGDSDKSRRQGYYQNSPTGHSSRSKGSRNQSSQDNYGGGNYQGGYGQNYGRGGYGYDGAPSGYGGGYDYSQGQAYDPNYGRNPAGDYYGGNYGGGYNANYPNPYQNPYGAYNTGYPSQYNPGYGQQTYDPSMMGGNPNTVNPSMASNTGAKTADPSSMASMGNMGAGGQMGANPQAQAQYSGNMATGYGSDPYAQGGYGYNPMQQGGYGNNADYMGYGNMGNMGGMPQQQGNVQGGAPQQAKYGGNMNQAPSPSQTSGYQKQGQSDIGPIKGGSKKPGAESRYYQPY